MKIQIWGCRGSIPRPNPEMARYGGNTPCIEVVASGSQNNSMDDNGQYLSNNVYDGHRIILDLGSGAVDLGQKVLCEMFQQKKKLEQMEKEKKDGEGDELLPAKPKFGGTILITHTHWDHIQGKFTCAYISILYCACIVYYVICI